MIGGIPAELRGSGDGISLMTFHTDAFSYAFTAGTYVPDAEAAEAMASALIAGDQQ